MKEAARSYFSFHRSQRLGIIILMSLLLILLTGLALMHFNSVPQPTPNKLNLTPASRDSTSGED